MSSSRHHKIQHHAIVPLGTQKIKTSRTIEDSMKKLTITDEKILKNKLVSDHKGWVGIKQEVVNRRTQTAKDRCTGTVKRVTHEVVSKNGVVLGMGEQGKVRMAIKDKSHVDGEKKHTSQQHHHHHHHHHHHQQPREVVKYESRQKYYREAR